MNKWWPNGLGVLALAGVLALRFYNNKAEAGDDAPIATPQRVASVGGLPSVKLSPVEVSNSGIRVARLEAATHGREIPATAVVVAITDLSRLRADAAQAQAQAQAAQAKVATSAAQVQRLRVLRQQEQEVSLTELQAAEATLAADRATLQAATASINASRQSATLQWGSVLGHAVFDGSATFQSLVSGHDVLVQVTLPSDAQIKQAPATLQLQTANGVVSARYLGTAMQTDPRLQGTSYFYLAPTASLRAGTSISTAIPTGEAASGLHVPSSAIVRWQGKQWIYTKHDTNAFIRRELPEEGAESDGWSVPAGFDHGEPAVIENAQLLLSEELRGQQKGDTE